MINEKLLNHTLTIGPSVTRMRDFFDKVVELVREWYVINGDYWLSLVYQHKNIVYFILSSGWHCRASKKMPECKKCRRMYLKFMYLRTSKISTQIL